MSGRAFLKRGAQSALALLVALAPACGRRADEGVHAGGWSPEIRSIDPPAAAEALAPNLARVGGSLVASWLEPTEISGVVGHRLRFAVFSGETWSEPVTIAAGNDFFANWADLPAVSETGSGGLVAHWLAKTGEETYAYSIYLARSEDDGKSWTDAGRLNGDETDTEHGFVSWLPGEGGARAFWLDGREMATGGPMALRTGQATGPPESEVVLDDRTCECCATDAAMTDDGPVVVYRDRSADEIRDIAIVRAERGEWTTPRLVHADGWRIEGCPVNGPAVAAAGRNLLVGWFTEAGESPAVKLARSKDAGRSFDAVEVADSEMPLGRVDLAFGVDGRAWMVWMRQVGQDADIMLRRVEPAAGAEAVVIGTTRASRASGFPKLIATPDSLAVAWTDVQVDQARRIRIVEIPLASAVR